MGILSKLLGSSSDIEKKLEEIYLPMFQQMMPQGKSVFYDFLKQAKKESQKEGTSHSPQNFGDLLLKNESTSDKAKIMLEKRRKEGVRDEDISWWWNMHDLERRMMSKIDDWFRAAAFIKYIEEEKLNENDASKRVNKFYPMFSDPENTPEDTGDDRPLPYELKDRINIYITGRKRPENKTLEKELEESSSCNSFIRREIRKGNI